MKLFGSRPHEWTRALLGALTGALTGPWWLVAQVNVPAAIIIFLAGGAAGGYLGRRIGRNMGELSHERSWRDWAREGAIIGAVTGDNNDLVSSALKRCTHGVAGQRLAMKPFSQLETAFHTA